jgi:NADH:ubiquinone reductase (H+-translocating)
LPECGWLGCWDKGLLATIGRQAAVARFGRIHLTGFVAWVAWLFIHLILLIGFRNRVLVLVNWAWAYFADQRGARLITDIVPIGQDVAAAEKDKEKTG